MVERIQQLSAAMAAGDADAVEAFYRHYFDYMYLQARRATRRDESFCLDVVQDAVLRVIRTVKAVESEPRFLSWLRLVVQTTAFDLLRNEKRRKNREAMAGISQMDVDADSLQLDWLQEQISAMDPELVKIIELRFEQSWTLRRIGETLGVSVGAVDGRLRRALKNLRLAAEPVAETPMPLVTQEQIAEIASAETEIATAIEPTPQIDAEALVTNALPTAIVANVLFKAPAQIVEIISDVAAPEVFAQPIATPLELAMVEIIVAPPPVLKVSLEAAAIVEHIAQEMPAGEKLDSRLVVIETVEATPVEWPELPGLEDEAGAYDDKL